MTKLFSRFLKDESGATAIEYGLIAALISVALITGATTLGTKIGDTFNNLSDRMDNAATQAAGTTTTP
ncbi:Flp family type IVb pilin [Rhizobium leguminosarum]|uniref:Flp family type IVb pilin n=1 Tax=Rhizobium leguminosarum TaxID=384 RepID=UPI001AE99FFB|nr:Flp family type IVb pilin [Rhizobium leguminosarum]MBP2442892.1 pilus assembly protein Flp/PilA [Rhizobium leguminosarum]